MAYDEYLAERIRNVLKDKSISFEEKKMMGGVAYMVDDKMCVGIMKNELMVRIDPDVQDEALEKKGSRIMDFTGKSMKGFLLVSPEGIDMEEDLRYWIGLALAFNPKAKSSKSRK